MPLPLDLPCDVVLKIFSYLDNGDPLSASYSDSSAPSLANISLVCKQLHAVAQRELLRSLRWCDKAKTISTLSEWTQNPSYNALSHVPKKLVLGVGFNFGTKLEDARAQNIVLHQDICSKIVQFTSLSALVLSETSTSAQHLYPILLLLPMLRSLAFIDVEFSDIIHDNDSDDLSTGSLLTNYPFTSLSLTHFALRGVMMSTEHHGIYDYDPVNFLRVPTLEEVEIMWTLSTSGLYMQHVHSKTGPLRRSGAKEWPNIDIPCRTLRDSTEPVASVPDCRYPFERLKRLTVHIPLLDHVVLVESLRTVLADCALHPTFDPRINSLPAPHSGFPEAQLPPPTHAAPQNDLRITLQVRTCRLPSNFIPHDLLGCLAPVVKYQGPISWDVFQFFLHPDLTTTTPTEHPLTVVSSFYGSVFEYGTDLRHPYNEAAPMFTELLQGLDQLHSAFDFPAFGTACAGSLLPGLRKLEIRIHSLDPEILYAIQQLFGRTLQEVVVGYMYYEGQSAKTLLTRLPGILAGIPRLRSFILLRFPDPHVVAAQTELQRHADAVERDERQFRQPRSRTVRQQNAPGQSSVEEFREDTATVAHFDRLEQSGYQNPVAQWSGGSVVQRTMEEQDQDVWDSVVAWGTLCPALWQVQLDSRYRFVRRFGEVGERWTRVRPLD